MGWLGDLANIAGKALDINALKSNSERNAKMQKQFAKQGIRWKVEDAKAAGIHPLYALGASTATFSPSYVGGGYGDTLAASGQAIDRAIDATRTQEERDDARAEAFMTNAVRQSDARVSAAENQARLDRSYSLDMQHKELQNTLLAAQIMRLGQSPANPTPSLSDTPSRSAGIGSRAGAVYDAVQPQPSKPTSADSRDKGIEAGTHPGLTRYRIGGESGATVNLPGEKLSESLEGMGVAGHVLGPLLVGADWLLKRTSGYDKPPDSLLPVGSRWVWDTWSQSWRAETSRKAQGAPSPARSAGSPR